MKSVAMQALNRLEEIKKMESSDQPSSTAQKSHADVLAELDQLPPPPKEMPKKGEGTERRAGAATFPRGENLVPSVYMYVHMYVDVSAGIYSVLCTPVKKAKIMPLDP